MANIEDISELSPAQQGILFHSLYTPDSGVYLIQTHTRLQGRLDANAFERAWRRVVERHPILRTFFMWEGTEKPVQVVLHDAVPTITMADIRGLNPDEQTNSLSAFLADDRKRGFDLSEAPLMRLALIRTGDDTWEFVWTAHHLIMDGWSTHMILKEAFLLHEAFYRGQEPHLDYSRPFSDYIAWLQKQDLSRAEAYWKRALAGCTGPTPLVANGFPPLSRTEAEAGLGEEQALLPAEIMARLSTMARQHHLTLNTLVQGAWALLLHRYSGEAEVLFGTTLSGRPVDLPGAEAIVGMFINTLPIKVPIPAQETVAAWLHDVQARHAELREYEYTPLVDVQGWSQIPRGTAMFDSLLIFENYPTEVADRARDAGLQVGEVQAVEWTNYPLTIFVVPGVDLRIKVMYDRSVIEPGSASRLVRHFRTLLEAMAANPERRLSELPMLTEGEERELRVAWNDTAMALPAEACVHELVAAQAVRTPNRVAVVCEGESLTFDQLNRRANQLAHYLRKQGVGLDVMVGICAERSLEMLVGQLGILKAGGAYVPLDPAYPQERLAFMMADAGMPVLLTQQRLVAALPTHGAQVVCLDAGWAEIAREPEENPTIRVGAGNLAYVIYTSGSTGKPKGVQLEHRSVVNFLTAMRREPGLTEADVLVAVTPISFDIAVLELFLPLTVGARVVIASREVATDGSRLSLLIKGCGATAMQATPATWRLLLEAGWTADLSMKMLCGGEALPRELAMRLMSGGGALWNMYGPTETTVWSSLHKVAAESGPVAIGRPIGNTRLYILDPHGKAVPVGVAGELHIGGAGLARGYLHRPELTAEKFIASPFVAGDQLYRTGDLARYRANGEIQYLGRIDDQVKIRGFRIELGEIEAVLVAHPDVQQAVVVAREYQPGDIRLVAYPVPETGEAVARDLIPRLRSHLTSALPEYMVPSVFVLLERLPLTPNGKVDRRALPAPDQGRMELEEAYTAPSNEIEAMLAGIWEQILGVNQIGVHDNFFSLGGHSLLATQANSRMREAFAIDLPLRCLFENPTVASMATVVETTRNGGDRMAVAPILPISRDGDLPLSFSQERVWFVDQLEPGSSLYNIPAAIRLRGPLDVGALEQSLSETIRRHETLRATFINVEGRSVQRIAPFQPVPLQLVSLTALPDGEREEAVRRLVSAESRRPFDLARGPLVRTSLLQCSATEHVLLIIMHHIISDGWSTGVLVREAAILYEAFAAGQPSPLPELPVQYVDFAAWQRNWFAGDVHEQQLAYWRRQLGGVEVLQLPTDHPRPVVPTREGAILTLKLTQALTDGLKALSRQEGVTLFMTLLATFQALLHRYTNQADIAVGSPVANRTRAETEGLIGFFANTLVLRSDLSGNPTFRELLERVRESTLGAYSHQDMPFEQLVEALQPERNLSHSPLFQVMFVLQNVPVPPLELKELTLTPLEIEMGTAKFELSLSMTEEAGGLSAAAEYSTELFEPATIARLLGHFRTLLTAIAANPEQRLSELPLLTEAEERQQLVLWNETAMALPAEACVHELVAAQAARTPDRVALSCEGESLTYEQLNRRANRLAHYLRKQGVGPEVLVGICLPRSLEMVIAILGILKAGGAYLPLDPAYPKERLAFILQDAGVSLLLSQGELVADLPDHEARLVCMDTDWESIERESDENPESGVAPDSLAYVIYTSGSTGKPKGALITHQNVVRLFKATDADFHFNQNDVWTLFHSFAFDFSVWEIWGALLHGGRLVVVPYWVSRSPEAFYDLLCTEGVTVLNQTPSAFRPLMRAEEELAASGELSLRLVIFGGEALEYQSLRPWFDRHGDRFPQLVNMYGITETTVHVTYRPLTAADAEGGRGSLIGRPIADLRVYVLDQHLQVAPIGVAGEMYVGGAGLARGYLNRPQLTEERFIPNPFRPGERLYKTGDLARYLLDGQLEYLGRIDDQVKIRGFRIELGEIEAALCGHMAIREALVLVHADERHDKRLVAYVVPSANRAPSVGELRDHLKALLPDYMLPATYLLLPAFPLTNNGKVDRRALPSPDQESPESETDYVAPRTPSEEMLAGIWAQVLGDRRIGVTDNFFDLGGHSLIATQVISRIRSAFGVDLPLKALFEGATVERLAARVEVMLREEGVPVQAQIPKRDADKEPPLSFAQQRLWFLDQFEPGSDAYNITVALRLEGRLDVAALEDSFTELVRRHEVLRTTFHTIAGIPVQRIGEPSPVLIRLVDLEGVADFDRESASKQAIVQEATRPFDLTAGPLLRVTLIRASANQQVLVLVMHHIISDGWSAGVLVQEATALYGAFASGQLSSLPALPIQYADFAAWQRNWFTGTVHEQQLAYWRRQLDGAAVLQLPTDRPRPLVPTRAGATASLKLTPALTDGLKALSRQEGVTLFMTLLAAFQALLHRYTNQADIAVGSPVANRNRAEVEGLIGFFVNTLVLRTDLSGDPLFLELLERVRESTLGAYSHQDMPFEQLVEALQPERDLSHSPFFQVMFAVQNMPVPALALNGLTLIPLEVESGTAKFDLFLAVTEEEGGLSAVAEYSTELFQPETIARLLGHFQTLLGAIAANPEQRLSELPLLTEAEERHQLVSWNDTAMALPAEACVHELVAAQAARTPDLVAVSCAGESLTYEQLNRRANRLAHYLRKQGVGPEVLVGICAERSLAMLVGVLAILKAGGGYLPLDPAYPQERLAFMMADAGIPVLLTQRGLLAALPAHGAQVVCLDTDWAEIARESGENPPIRVGGENLAYVIYTSGSTGKPKGVQLEHRSVVNFLTAMRQEPGLTEADVLVAVTPISFDIAVLELFLPLTVGARVVIASREVASDGSRLSALIKGSGATAMQATPATWRLLLEAGWTADLSMKMLCGGEALPRELAMRLMSGGGALWNMYGPTETTVWSSLHKVAAESGPVPIGRPIGNTQLHILDPYGRPVPVGVAGELHIGGAGLARGYLHRPDLTSERFISSPFVPGERLYRTGDLVRCLANGEIQFLGRIDDQVKIRGFRIELGEIEAVLVQHAEVQQAVVVAREHQPGDMRLVAYLVSEAGEGGVHELIPKLRSHLKAELPEYMVPWAFVSLDRLPLTPSGKVDRGALPAPEQGPMALEQAYAAPATETERILAGIWEQVLGVHRVGVDDNFFSLGGHSLLATVLISRVRDAFQVEIPLRSLFEQTTVAELARCIDAELHHGTGLRIAPIELVMRSGPLPLSHAQERLWFLDQLEPGSTAYNMPAAVRLDGRLQVDVLEESLNEVVRRHEILRTTFTATGGRPEQRIAPFAPIALPVRDLSGEPEGERDSIMRRLAAVEASRPFDLATGPLLRTALLRLNAEEHVLLVTMHHIISDGWSTGVFIGEVSALYEALADGQPSPLPELPVQYADFAVWQRDWLQGEVLAQQLAYWSEQLDGLPALQLPTDRPRPPVPSRRGASHSFMLSQSLLDGLNRVSRQEGATLFMTLLAAFQALLARYTGQEDLAVGTAIANRTRAEVEGLIGFFANTLVLRTNLAGNPTFRELLAQVRNVTLGAYANQDLPFEQVVEALHPNRDLSLSPLIQVMLILLNTPAQSMALEGLTLTPLELEAQAARLDLVLTATEQRDGLLISVEYSTDLFEQATITRMMSHFHTLLAGVASNPADRVAELPLLSHRERDDLLVAWNDTDTELPYIGSVTAMVEAQAARTPDRVAVEYNDERLTYHELNRRANQLAHYLRKLGVGPEVLVGLFVERSIEMIIALQGILKAGGAYLPLDPAYPRERLEFMLGDAQPPILLTQQPLAAQLPGHHGHEICLDTDWEEIARESGQNLEPVSGPDNLAYVIFTSGSSGRPKGVMIEQRSLVNLLLSMLQRPGLTDQDVFVALAPIAFDMSVPDMFLPLIAGARMVIAPREAAGDGRLLGQLLERSGATVLPATPATWRLLLESGWQGDGRLVIYSGGDALPRELAARLLTAGSRLWNLYGPTEATVWATLQEMEAVHGPVTVGRPMPNTQVYILDARLQPVPAGVAGELHIGGAGLARGYLNRPELTATAFINDPFRIGGRLYKTGDLARFLPDGTIEHLGRIDDQVKVRGFRIELGEIEVLLTKHPAVREAVVTTRADTRGDKVLVAYFVGSSDQPPQVGDLRSFLRAQLPEYMIPGIFVALERIPLSANGKVDRRALPAPEMNRTNLESAYLAPRTPVEELLAGIWAQLLGIERAGVHDNFFELGGHSLLATQVISRVRDACAVDLPLRSLFQNPTVAGMADAVEAAIAGGDRMAIAPILPISRNGELPLSFSQQRLWFVDQLEPAGSLYNIPAVISLSGSVDVGALEQSLNELIRRHETLRSTFMNVAGRSVQSIAPFQPVPLQLVNLTALLDAEREESVQRLVKEEAGRPFDLAQGPLLRATLLQCGSTEHLFLLTMHHIISDGWSASVLAREAVALYEAFAAGQPSPLPELPVQYVDFAAWQRNWFTGSVHEEQLVYWRQQLGGVEVLHLPTDHPRPAVPTRAGATASFTMTPALTESLKALSRQEGVTLFMTLLAAFQALMHRYSGQDDIAVGSPIANRNHVAIENLIGFFVNTLVLRTDLSGNPRFRELLWRVREVAMGAYAHQEMPFEQLVEALQPERNLSYTPLFQVSFAFDNTPAVELELDGLTIRPTAVDTATAKFDLSLSLSDRNGVLTGTLEYATQLFDQSTAARMIGHYQQLLESIAAEPDRLLSELTLLTEPEQHQVLVAWNETADSYPRDRCIDELVAEQARRTPSAVAVAYGEMRMTYAELDRQANQLAHYLRKLGVGPDVLVGICAERCPELVVGLLAIVKAGGAYLPLDPAYPEERLAFMLADSGVSVMVTQERLLDRVSLSSIQAVCLDRDSSLLAQESEAPPVSGLTCTNLAYVIYTSGSTGQPKGVEIEHGGLLNLLWWHRRTYNVTAADRATHLAGFAFDASVWEIWPYLTAGASLYLADEETRLTPERLRDWLVTEQITLSFIPTPMAEQLLLLEWPERVALRAMLTGGDKLHQYPAESLPFVLVNHYGPTENTVVATAGKVLAVTANLATPSIGRPIANAQVYLLDPYRQPVPIGVPGELHIGGDGLARGYRNRPELTSERFIPSPFSSEPGARLYKTGDLARYLSDGNIEFLGRIDAQVKIRGFRVELGEIEAVLAEHPDVAQAVVITREYQPGDVRLAAYVVPASITVPSFAELRSHLRGKLPDYMVPGTVTVVDEIPLTPNGKVDRKGLPEPDEECRGEAAHVGPRDALELQLATIWESVLGVRAVSVTANFFDLGGHSLIALRLLSQIQTVTGKQVPLPAFFQAPTVEQMATLLRRQSGVSTAWSPLVPLHAAGSKLPLFCVHPGSGTALPYATLARYLGEDQPLYGFQARGLDGREAPAERVAEMAATYVAAMRTMAPVGPYLLAGWSVGGVIAFEMAQQLRTAKQEVALLALLDPKLLDETSGGEESLVSDFVRDFKTGFLPETGPSEFDLSKMSDDEQLALILEIAVARALVPPDFDSEQLRHLLRVFQANHRAARSYTPKTYSGKAVLFLPETDDVHTAAGAPKWQELIRGGLDLRVTPGTHQTMMDLPHIQVLAQMLKESIDGVRPAVETRRMGSAGA